MNLIQLKLSPDVDNQCRARTTSLTRWFARWRYRFNDRLNTLVSWFWPNLIRNLMA